MDLGAALIGLFTIFVVKIAVMTLAGGLVLRAYRSLHKAPPRRLWLLLPDDDLPEARVLWWALVLFGVSELTCGVEVFIVMRSSPVLGVVHGLTSALGMALFALGIFRYLDRRIFGYARRTCVGNRICRGCPVMEGKACRYRALLLLGATFVLLSALPLFFAPTTALVADTRRYLLPFPALNTWFDQSFVPWMTSWVPSYDPTGIAYVIPSATFVLELRVLPAVAVLLILGGIVRVRRGDEVGGARVVVFATGVLAYAYFELVSYRVVGDVLLGSLGHEVVEFWFLVATAEFLSRTFGARSPVVLANAV